MLWSPGCIIIPNYLIVIVHLRVVPLEWESRGGRTAFYEWSRVLVCCGVRANADAPSVLGPPLSLSPATNVADDEEISIIYHVDAGFKSSVIEIWRWNLSSKGKASWSWQPVLLPLQLEATWQVAVERKEHGPTKGVFATVLQDSFSGPGSGPSLKRSGEMRITVLEMKKQHQEGCTLSGGKQSHRATIFNWQMWPSDGVFGQDLNLVLAAEGKAGFLGRASRG